MTEEIKFNRTYVYVRTHKNGLIPTHKCDMCGSRAREIDLFEPKRKLFALDYLHLCHVCALDELNVSKEVLEEMKDEKRKD